MSIEITPDLQKVLDASRAIPAVISAEITEVPAHLLRQIEEKECFYLDFVVQLDHGQAEIAFVFPADIVNSESYKHIPIEGLIDCDCQGKAGADIYNPYDNTGKTTYFVRKPDHFLIKLQNESPRVIGVYPPELASLVEKIKALDKVNAVHIETVVDQGLKEEVNHDEPVMIVTNIDIKDTQFTVYDQTTIVPKSVWGIESCHDYALDQIKEMIAKNNE